MSSEKHPVVVSGTNKKRKRSQKDHHHIIEKLQQNYGIDLPDIPGIPVEVIPLHVNALKETRKFFQHCKNTIVHPLQNVEEENQQNRGATGDRDTTVLRRMLQRIEGTAEPVPESFQTQRDDQVTLLRNKDQAVSAWLEAIRRQIRDGRNTQKDSVPLCAVQHLWNLLSTHSKVSVQRASLHLICQLLDKSADCRAWLFSSGETVATFMDLIAQETTPASLQQSCLQREFFLLIRSLIDKEYDTTYPILRTSILRLKQMIPAIDGDSVDPTNVMSADAMRQTRDIAMKFHDKEVERVNKILHRAQLCLDIMFPRLVDTKPTHTGETEDDDEDDIDWEDGWEQEGEELAAMDHADAVARTIENMRATANVRDGELVIQMENPDRNHSGNEESEEARTRLNKCLGLLLGRHMPRLSLWVTALTQADDLTSSSYGSSVLERMSRDKSIARCRARDSLMDLKSRTACFLATTKRLQSGLAIEQRTVEDAPITARGIPPSGPNLTGVSRHSSLQKRLSRPVGQARDFRQQRSHRIQIKYNKI